MMDFEESITVDVTRNSDGTFNAYIASECSSGAEYTHISSSEIGEYVAEYIDELSEHYSK